MFRQIICLMMTAACFVSAGQAAEVTVEELPSQHKPKDDKPMTTKMMKEGMMQGDVEKAANKRQEEMQPKLEQEEILMRQEKAVP